MATPSLIYLNGQYVERDQACIPIMDRGLLFGDSVYEVIPAYGGYPFRVDQHLQRLSRSLQALHMQPPLSNEQWHEVLQRLTAQLPGQDQSVYMQITRGAYDSRKHMIPDDYKPTVIAFTSIISERSKEVTRGISAITLEDIRWQRCDIKATTLLANVLAQQTAREAGATDAILLRHGIAKEGTASNLFIVSNGLIVTPPDSKQLLPGVTRDLVLEMAQEAGIAHTQAEISLADLRQADEIWLTSSTREIAPVTRLDDRPVGNGQPGPMWQHMDHLYQACKARMRMEKKCHD